MVKKYSKKNSRRKRRHSRKKSKQSNKANKTNKTNKGGALHKDTVSLREAVAILRTYYEKNLV